MMRSRFDEQLSELNRELIQMGSLCEEAIALAAKALSGEGELARRIPPIEVELDRMERDIETLCLRLLLCQQPVARDLRVISSALKMITDMERIGDQADDIAELILSGNGRDWGDVGHIRHMAAASIVMVTHSVDAYVRRDLDLAREVVKGDDEIDAAFSEVKASIIELIAKNPGEGEYALDLLMIAKYFERIGDHAVNIAQWVVFSATGEHEEETP